MPSLFESQQFEFKAIDLLRKAHRQNPVVFRYQNSTAEGQRALSELAGGYRGTLWSIIGDLDYFTKALLLPRSTLEKGPCSLCRRRGKGHLTWMDFRPTAPWRGVQWSTAEWRVWPQRSPSPLFTMEGFSPCLISLDWMHVKYLGHDMLVYGSVLSLLVHHVLPSAEPLVNLKRVWADIQWYYQRYNVPCRYRYLNRLSMFDRKAPQYPKLRGKAAEIKYLCGPLRYVWDKYHNNALVVHRQIALYLKMNQEIEETLIVRKELLALPSEDGDKFEETCTAMLLLLSSIAEHFITERLFNLTQKAHFLQHIALLARFINPRCTWCFMGEDMQKRMSTLAKTCVNGQRPGLTIIKMMLRYRIALHLRFQEHS